MNIKSLFIVLFISSISSYSQSIADIYDIARKGTVDEMMVFYAKYPSSLNTLSAEGFSALVLATFADGVPKTVDS